jgi:hypothetical protein
MDANYFFFPVDAVGLMTFRKSFLIDANSFRVGTCFNNFFRPSSMRGSL